MKLIGLGGLPASGKSTIFQEIIKTLGKNKIFKYSLLRGEFYEPNIYVFGTYDRKFGGTDTLSMAVQPIAVKFIQEMKDNDVVLIFEGDRLFNRSFIQKIKDLELDYSFYMAIADPEIIENRHKARGDTQSREWLQSRKTKYATIYSAYMKDITLLKNNNLEELKKNMEIIWQDLKNIT